jgi:xeroderma pigmentosum group C-complementing protein
MAAHDSAFPRLGIFFSADAASSIWPLVRDLPEVLLNKASRCFSPPSFLYRNDGLASDRTMPPTVPRKRVQKTPPRQSERPSKRRTTRAQAQVTTSSSSKNSPAARNVQESSQYVSKEEDSDDSSSSSESSDDFEDVLITQPPSRRPKGQYNDSDEDMDWEDAVIPEQSMGPKLPGSSTLAGSRDLELTLSKPDEIPAMKVVNGKKGASKKERFVRTQTHSLHVLFLLAHNAIRNSWLDDKDLQALLLDGLSDSLQAEIARWRRNSGLDGQQSSGSHGKKRLEKGKHVPRSKGNRRKDPTQAERDWSTEATRLQPGVPDMSGGDPIIRLMKYLASYWKKRFRITAPSLRKHGYKPPRQLHQELKAFSTDPRNTKFGERIENIDVLKKYAKKYQGSHDVSAQLFTALLRGLGIESRLVCSLQPVGFGWTKAEEARPLKETTLDDKRHVAAQPGKGSSSKPLLVDSSSELSDPPESTDEEIESMLDDIAPKISKNKIIDKDLLYPIYWTEVLSPITNTFYAVSTRTTPAIATAPDHMQAFVPKGAAAEKAKQVICYVVAFSSDRTAKDVTVRYLKDKKIPGKTKGFRLPPSKTPLYNQNGRIIKYVEMDWFKRLMSIYARPHGNRTVADDIEDQSDLLPVVATKASNEDEMPKSLQAYKDSKQFVLERHLRREEAILATADPDHHFGIGKGDEMKEEPAYRRADVVLCKSVETWHKEGREIKIGEQPRKHVPIRAVTLIRKAEIEQATRETGEKPLQGLYSEDQTQYIIPDSIENGVIPKNSYGNMDVYAPSMVPRGAVHVQLPYTKTICKKLGIDFAEACVGFDFGNRRAVPVLQGVVVAEENEELLRDAWHQEEERKRLKEDVQREALILGLWKKFTMGLRIVERIKAEYGAEEVDLSETLDFSNGTPQRHEAPKLATDAVRGSTTNHIDDAGGFFHSGEDEDEDDGNGGFHLNGDDAGFGREQSGVADAMELDLGEEEVETSTAQPTASMSGPRSLSLAQRHFINADEEHEKPSSAPSEDEGGNVYPAFAKRKRRSGSAAKTRRRSTRLRGQ